MMPTAIQHICPLCDETVVTTKYIDDELSMATTERLLRGHMTERHRVPAYRIIPILEAMALRAELKRRQATAREILLETMDGST